MREGSDFVLFDIIRFLGAIIYIAMCNMIHPPGSFTSRRVHVQCRYLCYHRCEQGMQGRNFIDSNECLCIHTVSSDAFICSIASLIFMHFLSSGIFAVFKMKEYIRTFSLEDPRYLKNSCIGK